MATVTKNDLIDRIAREKKIGRAEVRVVVQEFLSRVIDAVGDGDRLEFRDFGVFEVRLRAARRAQNPKTLAPVLVPPKRSVRFKPGRLMREALESRPGVLEPEITVRSTATRNGAAHHAQAAQRAEASG